MCVLHLFVPVVNNVLTSGRSEIVHTFIGIALRQPLSKQERHSQPDKTLRSRHICLYEQHKASR